MLAAIREGDPHAGIIGEIIDREEHVIVF